MAAAEDNYAYSTYASDDTHSYSMRTLSWWAALAASGGTANSANPLYGRRTRRRKPRMAIYADLTAPGRSVSLPVFTAAAYAALFATLSGTPATITRSVRGALTAKTYTLAGLIPEKVPFHTIRSSAAQGT